MSYASALLYGVSSDSEKPVSAPKPQAQARPQPKQQQQKPQSQKPQQEGKSEADEQPQQPAKVFVKVEGNDGGALGQLFRDEKNHVYSRKGDEGKKKATKTDRIFDLVIGSVGPAGISALGRTCTYFLTQVTLHSSFSFVLCCSRVW